MQYQNDSDLKRLEELPVQANQRGDDNEQQVSVALKRHGANFVPSIFNREERQLVQEHLIEELSQGFEQRREALNMVLETRLHSIREACNHVLVTGKTNLRQQRLEYFGKILRQVETRMNDLATDFLDDVDKRLSRLEQYKSEMIRKKEKQRLEKTTDNFILTLDQLMEEFRSIVSENIDHSKTLEAPAVNLPEDI